MPTKTHKGAGLVVNATASIAIALLLGACGMGGMTRTVTTAGQGFDRAECLAEQFRGGEDCDQDRFSQD